MHTQFVRMEHPPEIITELYHDVFVKNTIAYLDDSLGRSPDVMDCPCRVTKCMCHFCGQSTYNWLDDYCGCGESLESFIPVFDPYHMTVVPHIYDPPEVKSSWVVNKTMVVLRPPQDVHVAEKNSSHMSITWEAPEYASSWNVVYEVAYQSEFSEQNDVSAGFRSEIPLTIDIIHASSYCHYMLQIRIARTCIRMQNNSLRCKLPTCMILDSGECNRPQIVRYE